MRITLGAGQFLAVAAFIVVFGFFWRTLAARWKDNSVGQAMAFIF
jgi:hypothetical protein